MRVEGACVANFNQRMQRRLAIVLMLLIAQLVVPSIDTTTATVGTSDVNTSDFALLRQSKLNPILAEKLHKLRKQPVNLSSYLKIKRKRTYENNNKAVKRNPDASSASSANFNDQKEAAMAASLADLKSQV